MVQSRIINARNAVLASSALLLSALFLMGLPSAPASATEGACSDGDGVTVVVDFTDIGGEIVAGCAPGDPASGRGALEAAGFVATDSQPGMICAIDAQPDPCPAVFEGSFWSYWYSSAEGDWTSYQVGADSSDPMPGAIEGWRYSDGSAGPGIAPADVLSAGAPSATAEEAVPTDATPTAEATVTTDATTTSQAADATDNTVLYIALALAAVLAVLAVLFLARSRRRTVPNED